MPRKKPSHRSHPDHSSDLTRLNRIAGQLVGIRGMIEEGRYCPDIITQTQAIRSAIKSLEVSILERHLEHCVHAAMNSSDTRESKAKISELLKLWKRSGG